MDSSFVKELKKTAEIADTNAILVGVTKKAIVIPTDCKLADLSKHFPTVERLEARFYTDLISSFADYYSAHASKDCLPDIYIDSEKMEAKTIFDLMLKDSEIGHGAHRASLKAKKTSQFEAVLKAHEKKFSQKELQDFIGDYHESITAVDTDGVGFKASQAVTKIGTITVAQLKRTTSNVGNFSNAKTGLEQFDASADGALISTLLFKVIPYVGFTERTINIQLGIVESSEKVQIVTRIVGLDVLTQSIAEEFKESISKALPEPTKYFGVVEI